MMRARSRMVFRSTSGHRGCNHRTCGRQHGLRSTAAGFLEAVRETTTKHGALLIFDEVMTGFRVARGGAQQLYDIRPDITCLGKIIGGGLPVGAYGGSRELMRNIAPAGPIYQAGTFREILWP